MYEGSEEEDRERKIEKEKIEKSLSRVEPDIDNYLPSIKKPYEDVLERLFVPEAKPNIDIKVSSTEKPTNDLIEKEEEEETNKEDDTLISIYLFTLNNFNHRL